MCFLASCGQVSSNDLLRGLPLQSIFQHHLLNFWLPNFTKHIFHVERVPVMDLGGFVSADLFFFFPVRIDHWKIQNIHAVFSNAVTCLLVIWLSECNFGVF